MATTEQGRSAGRGFSAATRGMLAGLALFLPSLTLVPLGGLYLWEHKLLLWWALGALAVMGATTLLLKWQLRPAERVKPEPAVSFEPDIDPHWSDEEAKAWKDVLQVAARVEPDQMGDVNYFVTLGQTTLNAVANRLHPEKTDALWQFTLPEALAIVERVSKRLGAFVVETIPFGDSLTVAQVLSAYRWRGAFDVAEKAYDIWRIIRIVNPATAVTNEARERLSRAVYNYGKEHVSRRIGEAFVEEVGRAAIDLYGGRLIIAERLSQTAGSSDPLQELSTRPVAVNVAVGGGTRSERLAIATMLSEAADEQSLSVRTAPPGVLTTIGEPAALHAELTDIDDVASEIIEADVLIWIVSSADVEAQAQALNGAVTKARTVSAFTPPVFVPIGLYESEDGASRNTSQMTKDARTLAESLGATANAPLAVAGLDVSPRASIAALLKKIEQQLPFARRIHILRALAAAKRGSSWTRSARQAVKAASALTRAVVRRGRD